MLENLIGPPQIVALAVLIQRGLEELYSARNTRRLLAEGAHEEGGDYYPVVAVAHLAWIAAIFFLIPPDAPIAWPLAVGYLVLQAARYWVISTLGRYWTHRIITLDRAPVVRRGPYRFLRHPNYAVTIAETFLLPLVFGAWAVALLMAAIWTAVIRYKILLEDRAIAGRPETRD
jgi:methyltransferase